VSHMHLYSILGSNHPGGSIGGALIPQVRG